MTLPAAAARAPAAIDRCLLPAPKRRQAADVIDGTDRQTDGHLTVTSRTMRAASTIGWYA